MRLRPRLSYPPLPPLTRLQILHTWRYSSSPSASVPRLALPSLCLRRREEGFVSRPAPHRAFCSTPRVRAQVNHYSVLGVDPSISQPDLKKRFYVLSKEHHPDLHPDDKSAVQKFQEISESYSVLGDPEKRKRYDRDFLPRFRQQEQQHYGEQQRGGTYAGSRAPTGLSKRRSAFRGPPPSYFRHGEGGSYDPNVNPSAKQSTASSSSSANTGYDYHPGSYVPPGTASAEFDARPVYRTQSHEDTRRNARRAQAMADAQAAAEEESDFWARFVMVSLVLLATVTIGSLFVNSNEGPVGRGRSGGMIKGDGTRRDAAGENGEEKK